MPEIYERHARATIAEALEDTPVVLITGPRQSGKTTLARSFESDGRRYLTLDDETALAGALADPVGFLRGVDGAIIDEVQRAPALLRAVKKTVDEDRRPGRFLLTGSADLMTLPTVSESLAGRMEIVPLYPLSVAETLGAKPGVVDALFRGALDRPGDPIIGADLVERVLIGGFPEMLRRPASRRRRVWARDYVDALVSRDVRDIAEIDKADELKTLLRLLAHHVGGLLNLAQLGRDAGIDAKTVRRYAGILEQLFLVRRIEAWHRNDLKRLIKSPKLAFVDTGVLAALRGIEANDVARDRTTFGALLESFVHAELTKLAANSTVDLRMTHFRDKDGVEVDLVLEDEERRIVGIEIKAAATVTGGDFRGLRKLEEAVGDRFAQGYVLYDGEDVVPFGDKVRAAPLSALWG